MNRPMVRIVLVIAAVSIVAGGWWWVRHPRHPKGVNASEFETDLVAAVVCGILTEPETSSRAVCFLAFGEGRTSPSGRFLARFAGSHPAVRSCGSWVSPPVGNHFV